MKKKELQGTEEVPEADIHLDSCKATYKKVLNGKSSCYDSIHGFCFKKCMSIYDRLPLERSKYLEETMEN